MSVYGGFGTRQKEMAYNKAIFVLVREMSTHIVDLKKKLSAFEQSTDLVDNTFEKRLFKLHSIVTTLESEKYLEPHYSISMDALVEFLFNNSSFYKIPEEFILKRKEKIRKLKKLHFVMTPKYSFNQNGNVRSTKHEQGRKVFSEDRGSCNFSQPVNLSDNDISTTRPKTRPGTKPNIQINIENQSWMLEQSRTNKSKPQTRKSRRKPSMMNRSVNSSIKMFDDSNKYGTFVDPAYQPLNSLVSSCQSDAFTRVLKSYQLNQKKLKINNTELTQRKTQIKVTQMLILEI